MRRLAVVVGEGSSSIYEVLRYSTGLVQPVLLYDSADPAVSAVCERLNHEVVRFSADNFEEVVGAHQLKPFDAITTFSDDKVRVTAVLASRLGLRYHSIDTAHILTDKAEQRSALTKMGLGIPYRTAADAKEAAEAVLDIGAPCIVKPKIGSGSRNTYPVDPDNAAQTYSLPDETYPAVIEARLIGPGHPRSPLLSDVISVETVFSDGRPVHFGVSDHFRYAEPFRHAGMVTPSQLPEDLISAAKDVASRALAAVGASHGATQVELKLTAEGPVVIEVNGRLGGYVGRATYLSTGVSAVELALRAVSNKSIPTLTPTHVGGDFLMMAPVDATRLESRVPVEQLRAIDGVVAAVARARLGDPVDYRSGWQSNIACVWYQAHDMVALSSAHNAVLDVFHQFVRWG